MGIRTVLPERTTVEGKEIVGAPEQSPFVTVISLLVPVIVRAATTPVVVVDPKHPVARAPRACSALVPALAVCMI